MITLEVAERGRVTLSKELLEHMGLGPGDKIELEKLPNGRIQLGPPKPRRAATRAQ